MDTDGVGVEELLEVKDWLVDRLSKVKKERDTVGVLLKLVKGILDERASSGTAPSISDVKDFIGRDMEEILDFSLRGDIAVIRQRRFLEREVWLTVNSRVKELNGLWVSAGEDSRWEIDLSRTEEDTG